MIWLFCTKLAKKIVLQYNNSSDLVGQVNRNASKFCSLFRNSRSDNGLVIVVDWPMAGGNEQKCSSVISLRFQTGTTEWIENQAAQTILNQFQLFNLIAISTLSLRLLYFYYEGVPVFVVFRRQLMRS